MLAGMEEGTFLAWCKFFAEEPFGPAVQNLMLAQAAAAAAGGSPDDFLPLTVPVNDG